MGRTVAELAATMTERELALWARYGREQRFPTRRIEWHLAQLGQVIASVMSGSKASLSEFLVDMTPKPEPKVDHEDAAQQQRAGIAAVAGRGVYVLGKRKKG